MRFQSKTMAVLSILFVSTALFAQKVDLDPWRFTAAYRHYPARPLSPDFTTYNVVFAAPSTVKDNFSPEEIDSKVNLEGFKRVDRRGHITISINLSDVLITESKVVERSEDSKDKDKDGKAIKKYYYKPTAVYTFQSSAELKSYRNEPVDRMIMVPFQSKFTWTGNEVSSYKEADDFFRNNRTALRSQFIRERVNESLAKLSQHISHNYGYPFYTKPDLVYLLDVKKHPEYEGHQRVVRYVKDVLGVQMVGDNPIDDAKAQFEPLRTYLEETVKKYKSDEKGDKKMRYAAYFALAKISYWLDEPDDCIQYAEKLIANDFDPKDGKKLIEEAQELKATFVKFRTKTRHFRIDTEPFKAPE